MRRLIASLLICTLLAGCATNPDGSYDSGDCSSVFKGDANAIRGGNPGDVLVGIVALLVVEGIFYAGCEAAVGIGNGWRHYHPVKVDDGFYLPPDKLFSVAIPRTPTGEPYEVREKPARGKDAVLFLPPKPGPQDPVFGIVALMGLDPMESSESLDALSQQVTAQLPEFAGPDIQLQQMNARDFALHGVPMRLVVYHRTPGPGQVEAYQFLYFVRDSADHTAAVLSVSWPQACPPCGQGTERDIRMMDPRLNAFVESFVLDAPP